MLIQRIENTRPIQVDEVEMNTYVTHTVWLAERDEPILLVSRYNEEGTSIFPGQFDIEIGQIMPIPEEVSSVIGKYIEENPLEVLTLEQVQEVSVVE